MTEQKTILLSEHFDTVDTLTLTLKRGNQVKKYVTPSFFFESLWESSQEYYMDDLNWSEEKFENYWDNGGEEKEYKNFVSCIVDQYDNDEIFSEL